MLSLSTMVSRLIEHAGMTEASIGEAVGASQPTIHRIKKGETKDPKSSLADALRALYAEKLPEEPERGDERTLELFPAAAGGQ